MIVSYVKARERTLGIGVVIGLIAVGWTMATIFYQVPGLQNAAADRDHARYNDEPKMVLQLCELGALQYCSQPKEEEK